MNNPSINLLKTKLKQMEGLTRICKSQDYQEYLKPILQEAFNNKWPDPTKAVSVEEFHKQYSEQYGRAMAYRELYNILENADIISRNVAEQIKNPTKNYGIGS